MFQSSLSVLLRISTVSAKQRTVAASFRLAQLSPTTARAAPLFRPSYYSSLSSRSIATAMSDHDDGEELKLNDASSNKKRHRQDEGSPPSPTKTDHGSRRRRAWADPRPPTKDDVAPGSYANESLRKLLGIDVPATTFDNNDNDDDSKLPSKRKVALLVGYFGTRYGGFQMNADQRTVQAELELALLKAKLLSQSNFGFPFKYNWSTSGRTDKGVHACAQVCGVKIHMGNAGDDDDGDGDAAIDAIRHCINEQLPSDVRVLHLVKTTRGFCAKNMRAHVRYQYMIPSFCLHPNLRQLFIDNGITWNDSCNSENGERARLANDPLTADELRTMQAVLQDYRATPDQLERLQHALSALEGTHSFHNFTKSVTAKDAKASRYILSYNCLKPVVMVNGMEWIPTQVLGQSFLVYQVRKMTSLVIDIARGAAPLSVIHDALAKNDNGIRLNVAPAQGLLKEMSYYGGYNQRKQQANAELANLDWDKEGSACKDRWTDFKAQVVEHIVQKEIEEANFVKYMFNQEFIFDIERHYKMDGHAVGEVEAKAASDNAADKDVVVEKAS